MYFLMTMIRKVIDFSIAVVSLRDKKKLCNIMLYEKKFVSVFAVNVICMHDELKSILRHPFEFVWTMTRKSKK